MACGLEVYLCGHRKIQTLPESDKIQKFLNDQFDVMKYK